MTIISNVDPDQGLSIFSLGNVNNIALLPRKSSQLHEFGAEPFQTYKRAKRWIEECSGGCSRLDDFPARGISKTRCRNDDTKERRRPESLQLPFTAVLPIRPMRGASQSHLMMCSDGQLWVVKFQNNPQHLRILANEFIVSRIAEIVGLSVPRCDAVHISRSVVEVMPKIVTDHDRGLCERYSDGLQLGSRYIGGLMPGQVVDTLTRKQLDNARNLGEFAGMLAIDKWTANCDTRQTAFARKAAEQRYRVAFIDQGHCFGGGKWTFSDSPIVGVYPLKHVYSNVIGWNSFEPWISRIEEFDVAELWKIAEEVPAEWYAHDQFMLEQLIHNLIIRRRTVRARIEDLRRSKANPFSSWNLSRSVGAKPERPSSQARPNWKGRGDAVRDVAPLGRGVPQKIRRCRLSQESLVRTCTSGVICSRRWYPTGF